MAREALPEITVHRQVEAWIEAAHRLVQPPPPEHRRLRNEVVIEEEGVAKKGALLFRSQKAAVRIDPQRVAVHRLHVRMGSKESPDPGQRTGQQQVVRAQPALHLTAGVRKTLDQRIGLALVGFTDPVGQRLLVALDHGHAGIRRTAIDDDVLEPGIALIKDGAQRCIEVGALLIGAGDD